jgi:hypothetical protein
MATAISKTEHGFSTGERDCGPMLMQSQSHNPDKSELREASTLQPTASKEAQSTKRNG